MAKIVYNFVGVSSPAGALSHKGFIGDTLGDIPTPPSGTEGEQADYDAIEAVDASRWQNAKFLDEGYPFKIFRWYIPPEIALPWKFIVTHVGWVPLEGEPGYAGFYLKIYNVKTQSWELLDTSGSNLGADDVLTGSVKGVRRYYMDSDRYAWTGVRNVFQHTAITSKRWDNYTELELEWWAGMKRWGAGWGEGIEPPYGEV